MNRDEVLRLRHLARSLGSSPRRVLVKAAQGIDSANANPREILHAIRDRGERGSVQAEECANLILTPVSSYARDTLDMALGALWRVQAEVEQ